MPYYFTKFLCDISIMMIMMWCMYVNDNSVLYTSKGMCLCIHVRRFSYWLWFYFLHFLSIGSFIFSFLIVCYFGLRLDSLCQLVKKETLTFPGFFFCLAVCSLVYCFLLFTMQFSNFTPHEAVWLKVKVEWLKICKRKYT